MNSEKNEALLIAEIEKMSRMIESLQFNIQRLASNANGQNVTPTMETRVGLGLGKPTFETLTTFIETI